MAMKSTWLFSECEGLLDALQNYCAAQVLNAVFPGFYDVLTIVVAHHILHKPPF